MFVGTFVRATAGGDDRRVDGTLITKVRGSSNECQAFGVISLVGFDMVQDRLGDGGSETEDFQDFS